MSDYAGIIGALRRTLRGGGVLAALALLATCRPGDAGEGPAGLPHPTPRSQGAGAPDHGGPLPMPAVLIEGETARRCAAPADVRDAVLAVPGRSTPETTAALRAGVLAALAGERRRDTLRIVALGSSTTAGVGAEGPANAYPAVLEQLLRTAVPVLPVRVVAAGVSGDDTRQMVARIARDVLPLRPALVVWQTGTNDVPRDLPLDVLARLITVGVAQMRAAGIEVVLLDAQVAPAYMAGEAAASRFAAVQDTLRAAGSAAGATTMPRFAWSRAVLATGQLRLTDLVARDGLHPTDLGHACAARLLAVGLVHSAVVARQAPPAPLPSDPAP